MQVLSLNDTLDGEKQCVALCALLGGMKRRLDGWAQANLGWNEEQHQFTTYQPY